MGSKRFRPGGEGYPIDIGGGWRAALEMDTETRGWVFLEQDGRNMGAIAVDRGGTSDDDGHGGPVWHLEQDDPLTLSPSVWLKGVVHDFIKGGRWQNGGAAG